MIPLLSMLTTRTEQSAYQVHLELTLLADYLCDFRSSAKLLALDCSFANRPDMGRLGVSAWNSRNNRLQFSTVPERKSLCV